MPRNEVIYFNWEKLPKVVHYQASMFNSFCLPGTCILWQKVAKSTAGHLFLQILYLPGTYFVVESCLMSTVGHLSIFTHITYLALILW